MAAFPYQHLHHPFHLLPPFPNDPPSPKMSDATADDFSEFYHPHPPSPLRHGSGIQLPEKESSMGNKQGSESAIVVNKIESGEQVTQKIHPKEKKRKKRNGSVSSSVQSKQSRRKRNKAEEGEGENEKEVEEEAPPTGYVHVRARRGQATDSHSLAERVRREKISERMNMLQRLVPGCDKVTWKALVLDEIINYVHSLQNQVEFLSMKLASVNPLSYQFEHDLDSLMATTETISRSMGSSNLQQCSVFTDYVSTFSHPFMDHSASILLDQRHKSMPFYDSVNLMWGGEDPDQKLVVSPALSNNLCSFNQ